MSLVRQTIARHILRAPGSAARRPALNLVSKRGEATSADGKQLARTGGDTSQGAVEQSEGQLGLHTQPNYAAEVDQASSLFSPVPKRIMDGSEESGALAAAVLSGAPIELQARQVRIYKQAKTATQSGDWHGHHWRMDWDILEKGHRWENPLMGWQSSADFMQGTHLNFKSLDDAVRFAEKQGYEYFVSEPNSRKIVPKSYSNNFLYSPGKLKHIRTK